MGKEKSVASSISLRDVHEDDLTIFFKQQLDADANHMAAFTAKDPADRVAFDAHWSKIMGDEKISIKTILLYGGEVAGHVLKYVMDGKPEVSYWVGKEYWGKGIATQALLMFLNDIKRRPIYARAAKDNSASVRVLEKCGFSITGNDRGYANARGEEIEEVILEFG